MIFTSLIVLESTGWSATPPADLTPSYGMIPGYIDDVSQEMSSAPKEMVLMEKPDFLNKPELKNVIFNKELSDEFIFRYKQQFGFTEQEHDYFLVQQQGYYMSPTGLTTNQEDNARQAFAQYMVKRLAEYHTENIMKNDPNLKAVYEIKQQVSNYKFNVGPQSKLDMNYSFVGNFANVTYITPWGTSKATINMDPSSLVPGSPTEVMLLYTRPVSRTVRFETSYLLMSQAYRVMLEKTLTKNMTTNISETVYLSDNILDVNRPELTLLGFNYSF